VTERNFYSQEMLNELLKFEAVYKDKISRLNTRLRDLEEEVPDLQKKRDDAVVSAELCEKLIRQKKLISKKF